MARQMVMVGFLQAQNCTNLPSSWRHPESRDDSMSADYYQEIGRILESGKFHIAFFDDRLAMPVTADANDFIYQWEASHDYNPVGLERIAATLLAINAADDERNPPETGVTEAALKHVKNGRLYLIPASAQTRGHLTTGNATFYQQQLRELLRTAPQRTM